MPKCLQIRGRPFYSGFALFTTVVLVPQFDAVDAGKGKLDCVNRCFGAVERDGGSAVVVVEDEEAAGGAALVFGGAGSVFDMLICGHTAEGEGEALLEDCRRAGSMFSAYETDEIRLAVNNTLTDARKGAPTRVNMP
ncbi:hypothetical protein BDD12DRAFT_808001 [Trichophaea hybrida]|nr:hypothetical protein BDD12DRAFT_808001 [Trichophaea hybrida]